MNCVSGLEILMSEAVLWMVETWTWRVEMSEAERRSWTRGAVGTRRQRFPLGRGELERPGGGKGFPGVDNIVCIKLGRKAISGLNMRIICGLPSDDKVCRFYLR